MRTPMNSLGGVGAALLALLAGLAGPAHAVDGVIEINQAQALAGGVTPGDAPGFPVDISASGSYRLTGDLDATGADRAVQINVANVTLDLNGFTIANAGVFGITTPAATSALDNLTVRNGTVLDSGTTGLRLGDGDGARVDEVRVLPASDFAAMIVGSRCHVTNNFVKNVTDEGIFVDSGCIVSGNVVEVSGGRGIVTLDGCTITNNTVAASGTGIQILGSIVSENAVSGGITGIQVLTGSVATVFGNRVSDASGFGLSVTGGAVAAIGHNVFWSNNGGNTNPQLSGTFVEVDANLCGADTTCP
jgi:hypothetical protein